MSYTLVIPDQVEPLTNMYMLALAIYREARGEAQDAKIAVGWVIRNRVARGGWFGKSYFEVVTKRSQFSSFNLGEPNSIVFGGPVDKVWKDSLQAAVAVVQTDIADPTGGSTFYYDKSLDANPPAWAKDYTHVADIGNFHFFKQSAG